MTDAKQNPKLKSAFEPSLPMLKKSNPTVNPTKACNIILVYMYCCEQKNLYKIFARPFSSNLFFAKYKFCNNLVFFQERNENTENSEFVYS